MKTTRCFSLALGAAVALTVTALGQGFGRGTMGMPQQRVPSRDIEKLFGKSTAFTADATIFTKRTPNDKAAPSMEFSLAMLDGKVRTEIDLTKSHAAMSNDDRAMMEQMGMSRLVHVILPEQKVTYSIYPAMKAYCVIPNTQTNVQSTVESKVDKTELGKETVDGHPCVKWKIVTTDANGKTSESIQWQATDLKDFPIKSEAIAADGSSTITLLRNINLSKPSASLFEPPADFQRYNSMQELMMSNMQRMMPPEATPNPRRGFGGSE